MQQRASNKHIWTWMNQTFMKLKLNFEYVRCSVLQIIEKSKISSIFTFWEKNYLVFIRVARMPIGAVCFGWFFISVTPWEKKVANTSFLVLTKQLVCGEQNYCWRLFVGSTGVETANKRQNGSIYYKRAAAQREINVNFSSHENWKIIVKCRKIVRPKRIAFNHMHMPLNRNEKFFETMEFFY